MAVNTRIERIVGTDANIGTRVNLRTALSYEDVACYDELAVTFLSAESFRLRVTTVLGRTHTFLMSEELQIHL